MAERSKALVLGTSLRAWVRIPLVSNFCLFALATHLAAQVSVHFIHRKLRCLTKTVRDAGLEPATPRFEV
ncbi:hypothetical protein PF005_g31699 [Phytophthora fragariae]|uniref:Uncharacterized protein n=1 Tax=Phytophthora fragariae TaxID=53985 RepID=A0A6A3GGV0_9STRA|nr:hypothetical protein PF003_g19135 [Phytophthora fragariae]KAE8896565.1 hypothetical protein PF003_g19132 [Phytophthora fragariae]KAE8917929.1 hypothetical protein PF009_g31753 [Phytophthora fragariae]KAE8957665.1 hypothetical protein PF011_g31062 [Phytophthora fragariae]KAE9057490.1 hypothetical protein PF010_g31357 [Phytophthora fragariae]